MKLGNVLKILICFIDNVFTISNKRLRNLFLNWYFCKPGKLSSLSRMKNDNIFGDTKFFPSFSLYTINGFSTLGVQLKSGLAPGATSY